MSRFGDAGPNPSGDGGASDEVGERDGPNPSGDGAAGGVGEHNGGVLAMERFRLDLTDCLDFKDTEDVADFEHSESAFSALESASSFGDLSLSATGTQ